MKPHIILIDLQKHFIKDKSTYQEYDFTHQATEINKYLKDRKLKTKDITIVVDTLAINEDEYLSNIYENYVEDVFLNNYFEKDFLEFESIEENDEELYYEQKNEIFEKFIIQNEKYLKYNINSELSIFINELNENSSKEIELVKKEYGYIRNIIDGNLDIAFFISKLKAEMIINDIDNIIEVDIENIGKTSIEIESIIKILSEKNMDLYDIQNYLDDGHYISYEMVEEKYNHLKKDQEILLIGGGATECLLEEFISLKVYGFNNIEINENLVYGNIDNFKSSIDTILEQENIFKEKLKEIEQVKFINSFPNMYL